MNPIGLAELIDRAALLTRRDRKYVLPAGELPALYGGLGADVRVLEIDGRREFGYRSVYYDTPRLDSYLASARGRRRRYKVRIRSYLDTGGDFLEVKTRQARDATVKHRFPHHGQTLDADARSAIASVLTEDVRDLAPVLVTSYRRTTLFIPATGARVTVDTDLCWELLDGTVVRSGDQAIVETKSPIGPASEVDRLLWSLHHRPCALSKYGTGLAMLRPELPANRWHPVLRRLGVTQCVSLKS